MVKINLHDHNNSRNMSNLEEESISKEPLLPESGHCSNTSVINIHSVGTAERTRDRSLEIVKNILLYFLKRCWKTCSGGMFVICVMYWCYGSWIALLLCVFALTGFFFQISDYFLYHPNQPAPSRIYIPQPSLFGMPFENISILTADRVKLHAFFIPQGPPLVKQVPTVLYFHGNAGNIGHRLPNAKGFYKECGYNLFLLEYRGYGHSGGSPYEEGLYLDAQAGLQYLLQHPYIDKSKIVVFGRSLGGAVAIDLMSHPKFGKHVMALIVENTFTSIPDIAKEMFSCKLVEILPNWAFKNQYLSLKKIVLVSRPTLFISGQADALVPPCMMRMLFQACGNNAKNIIKFDFGTHNETWQCKGYYKAINLFIDDVMLSQEGRTMIFNAGREVY